MLYRCCNLDKNKHNTALIKPTAAKADEHFNSIIEEKDSNIEELTKSNAFLSKIVHRDNHLMSSLQYSLEELCNCNDKQKESKIITELLTLAKERNELVQKEQAENKVLASTGNSVIDGRSA